MSGGSKGTRKAPFYTGQILLMDKGGVRSTAKPPRDAFVSKTREEIETYLNDLARSGRNEEAFIVFPDGRVLHRCCDAESEVSLNGLDLRGADIFTTTPRPKASTMLTL